MLRWIVLGLNVAFAAGGSIWLYKEPFASGTCLAMGAMVMWFIHGDIRFDEIIAQDAKKAELECRDWERHT